MTGTADFLLELLSEEIPARMQARARGDLAKMMAEALGAAGLSHGGIETFSTPRRLALIVRGLPAETESFFEELKGPRTTAPPQALEGFLKKTGLVRDQLVDREGVLFAIISKEGRATTELLAEAVAAIVRDFPWPKAMRWGAASASTSSMRWVRPLHSIVALLGDAIVPVAIDGVACGATTLGHRFHHPGPITIGGAHDYVEKLRACHVRVDHAEREAIVRDGAARLAKAVGHALVEDEGLVVENAGLTEWPVPLLGGFEPAYLDLPEEVIQLTARINQKYFVLRDGGGRLAPHFICTANIDAHDGGAAIVAGNERVLAARLSDARFFWQQDLKVPLAEQAARLSQIVFHEKLGTVADKVERVARLARWLVEEGIVKGASADDAERAARLAKADLVTGMVGEFPELQGVIGGRIARERGESVAVADAIRDHYKPVGQGDDVPTAPVTVAVSLADKLDTIIGFFAISEKPTGSKDPFALRRAVLGIINIIRENALFVPLDTIVGIQRIEIAKSLGNRFKLIDGFHVIDDNRYLPVNDWTTEIYCYNDNNSEFLSKPAPEFIFSDEKVVKESFSEFVMERLRVRLRDVGVRHDVVSSILPKTWADTSLQWLAEDLLSELMQGGQDKNVTRSRYRPSDQILWLEKGAVEIARLLETKHGMDMLSVYRRISPVLPDVVPFALAEIDPPKEVRAMESWAADLEKQVQTAIKLRDFQGAITAIADGKALTDALFENVKVLDSDVAVRAARLALLDRIRNVANQIADFSKIEG